MVRVRKFCEVVEQYGRFGDVSLHLIVIDECIDLPISFCPKDLVCDGEWIGEILLQFYPL